MYSMLLKIGRLFVIIDEDEQHTEKFEKDWWTVVTEHSLSTALLLVVIAIAVVHYLTHQPPLLG